MAKTNQIAAFLGLSNRNTRSSVFNIPSEGSSQRQFTMLSWATFQAKVRQLVPNVRSRYTRLGEPYTQHGYIAFFSEEAWSTYSGSGSKDVKEVVLHNLIDAGKAKWVKTSADVDEMLTALPEYSVAAATDEKNGNHNAVEDLLDEFLGTILDRILVTEKEHEITLGLSKLGTEVRTSKLLKK